MHLALITLFSIEQKEKKVLIARSEDFVRNKCAF